MSGPVVVVLGHFPDLARMLVDLDEVCELWLVADDVQGPLAPYERVVVLPVVERAEILAAIRAEVGGDRVAAILPGRERYTTLAAATARALRVRPDLPDAYRTLEDKYLLRVAARAAGLGSTFFTLAESSQDVRDALRIVGGSGVVTKPARGNGSRGVTYLTLDSPDEAIATAVAAAVGAAGRPEFLIEEFVPGAGFSVEVVLDSGRCTFANVTGKTLSGAAASSPFIPVQHTVPAIVSPSLTTRLVKSHLRFLECVGASTGLFHGEWQVRPDGALYLIECAARFPGGGLGDAAEHSYGVNLAHRWVRALLGDSPVEPLPTATGHTASISFLAPRDGLLQKLHGLDVVGGLAETIAVVRRVADGSSIRRGRSGSDRLLTVTVHAEDGDTLTEVAARVRSLVRVEVR